MALKLLDVVQVGKEAARGTVAASFPLQLPVTGGGLIPTITNHLGEVVASSTYPAVTEEVPLGTTAVLSVTPDLNVNSAQDIILAATKRSAAGELPSLSIRHSRNAVGTAQYLGCAVRSLNLAYSASGDPSDDSILRPSLELDVTKPESIGGSITPISSPTGRRFRFDKISITLDGVAATKVFSYSRQNTIERSLGRPDANNARIYMEDGLLREEITLVAMFTAVQWSTLALSPGTSDHTLTIVHSTAGANETITETIAKCQVMTHRLADSNATVTEEITIRPYGANSTVWSFGSAVPLGLLSL